MMASYPCTEDNPRVEPWLDLEEWSHCRVFRELTSATGTSSLTTSRAQIGLHLGSTQVRIAPSCELRSTLYPWRRMCQILKTHASGSEQSTQQQQTAGASQG
eukprot:6176392-Pleurochrysis_carterae.AAC.1